jgi:glycosyltransferase involved in cell wall biosynthesis
VLTFSVVIPNFNQSCFLPWALESLRHQSTPFNLAVMDGASTDNFKEVVDPYSDIITFLRSKPDAGQAAAIREGIDTVPGDIVAWLNADDYYFPQALDKVAACFKEDLALDVVYGDAVHVTSEGFFLSYFPAFREYNTRDLTRHCFICQPSSFVRRSAYEAVGGLDSRLHYTMDWDLWCRLASAGAKFKCLREPLAAVRYYPGTKTLSGNWRRYLEIWRIEKKYGRRPLPWSWPWFYLFDLTYKKRKTPCELMAFGVLNLGKHVKKTFLKSKGHHVAISGFRDSESSVKGRCAIHLPWYDRRKWKRLHLKVEPAHKTYQISINGKRCDISFSKNGDLMAHVPELDTPLRQISVECVDGNQWRLLGFACTLENHDQHDKSR